MSCKFIRIILHIDIFYQLTRPFLIIFFLILGGPLNLYHDHNLCMDLGVTIDGDKNQCISAEGFASFLGLLQSIPFHGASSDNGSFEYAMPDLRYENLP